MKKNGFTRIQLLTFSSVVIITIAMIWGAISITEKKREELMVIPKPTQVLEDVQNDIDVVVKIQGYCENWPYIIFEDRATHTRILFYRGAMTYLSSKTNKFNVEE